MLVDGDSLKSGKTRSCGHARVTARRQRADYTGQSRTPEYITLCNIIAKCTNPTHPKYAYYGARGITVCDRWRGVNGFDHFLADMGPRPSKQYSLDRINNNGNYEPSNCRWATATQQNRNTRRTKTNNRVLVNSHGEAHTVFEWAEITGVKPTTVNWRLAHGATVDEAVTPGDKRRTSGRPVRADRHEHPDYQLWTKMRRRCVNPADPKYADYGGRGIKVCARWQGKNGFTNFIADMGPRPPRYTLDRIDVNGDYEPSNCRWASQRTQQNNRRDNVHLVVNGVNHTAAEWATITGMDARRVRARITEWGDVPPARIVYPGDPRRLSRPQLAVVDAGDWLQPFITKANQSVTRQPQHMSSVNKQTKTVVVADIVNADGRVVMVVHGDDPEFALYQELKRKPIAGALRVVPVHVRPYRGRRCADLKALVDLRVCMHSVAGNVLNNRPRGTVAPVRCVNTGDCWLLTVDAVYTTGLLNDKAKRHVHALAMLNRTGLTWAAATEDEVNQPRLSPFTLAALRGNASPVPLTDLTDEERVFLEEEWTRVQCVRLAYQQLTRSVTTRE